MKSSEDDRTIGTEYTFFQKGRFVQMASADFWKIEVKFF